MSSVMEFLGGIYRYLPNTLTATLMVGGIAFGRVPWIMLAFGAIVLSIILMVLHMTVFDQFEFAKKTGVPSLVSMCSVLPTSSATLMTMPSMWITISVFYATYIITNAVSVYKAKPSFVSKDAISVQQRKSVGIISILTTALLFAFVIAPRLRSDCETLLGGMLGAVLGMGFGVAWWHLLNACGEGVSPDIHGVMIGLKRANK